jgi:hypothetical protein
MTAKEKAIELVKKFRRYACMGRFECKYERHQNAKKIAIIAVDEAIEEVVLFEYGNPILVDKRLFYWNEVKQEIEKL